LTMPESTLPKNVQELAMLITVRAMDCPFRGSRSQRRGHVDPCVNGPRCGRKRRSSSTPSMNENTVLFSD
jgi:hypothetical protein